MRISCRTCSKHSLSSLMIELKEEPLKGAKPPILQFTNSGRIFGRIFFCRSPCGLPAKKSSPKIRVKIRTQKKKKQIRTKIRTHKIHTQKSAQNIRNPPTKIRTASGCSEKLSSRNPPTQDLTMTLGEDMRWAKEQIKILLPWTANTCV